MVSIMNLLPRQVLRDSMSLINPKGSPTVGATLRGNASHAHIAHRPLLLIGKGGRKSKRLDARVFFKNSAWEHPASESLDEETAELLDRYAATFQEADTDKDGLLHRAELRTILERVGNGQENTPLHWLHEEDLDKIFNQYDTDGNNAIDLNEFMKLAQDNVFLTKELSDYRAAFRAVDQNHDGFLGPTELLSVLSKVDSPLKTYDNIVRLMNKYDTDRNGKMDFGEFLRLCRYEQALPLDAILNYAASVAGSGPFSTSRTSSSTASHKEEIHNSSHTTTTSNTSSISTSNVISATSLSSTTTPTTSPSPNGSTTTTTAGNKNVTEKHAHNEHLVIAIANEEYFNGIFECNKDKLVVVMGSLTWCRPCKRFNPVYQRMAAAYPEVIFLHLNGNDNEETKRLFKHKLKIRATPSFLFFKNGICVDNCSGANASRFESHLRALLREDEMPEKSLYELIDVEEDKKEAALKASNKAD